MNKTLILILFVFYTCSDAPEYFVGKWQILSIVENNESIDLAENWIHLRSDGTFESYDGVLDKIEMGKWVYQHKEKQLFIDGQEKDGDSYWHLSIKKDTLIFQSTSDKLYLVAKKME